MDGYDGCLERLELVDRLILDWIVWSRVDLCLSPSPLKNFSVHHLIVSPKIGVFLTAYINVSLWSCFVVVSRSIRSMHGLAPDWVSSACQAFFSQSLGTRPSDRIKRLFREDNTILSTVIAPLMALLDLIAACSRRVITDLPELHEFIM